MNNQKILDNAPEGATHIDKDCFYLRYDINQVLEIYHVNYKHWQQASAWIGVDRSLADIKRITELQDGVVKANNKLISCAVKIAELEKTLKDTAIIWGSKFQELEKELATSKPPPNLIWFDRGEVLGLDPEQTGVIDLRGMKLEQQAKGLTDYAKEQEQGLNAVWMIAAASKLNEQAKALQEQG
jgi:hypothetical protein